MCLCSNKNGKYDKFVGCFMNIILEIHVYEPNEDKRILHWKN